jgi:hypothetical protein
MKFWISGVWGTAFFVLSNEILIQPITTQNTFLTCFISSFSRWITYLSPNQPKTWNCSHLTYGCWSTKFKLTSYHQWYMGIYHIASTPFPTPSHFLSNFSRRSYSTNQHIFSQYNRLVCLAKLRLNKHLAIICKMFADNKSPHVWEKIREV